MSKKNKSSALKSVISSLDKRFGSGTVMRLGDRTNSEIEVIPTGSLSLNEALGIQGYPKGRIVEIFGPESSGKTTLTLHAIAEAQKAGGTAAFVDAEHAFDVSYAASLGIDVDNLLISQPNCGEEALEIVESLVRSGAVDIVVIDSVAALTPRAELEGDMGDSHMGLQARLMSQALRKVTGIIHKTGCLVIFINQIRQKIGVTWGNGEVTTGGNALKFYSSIRLEIRRIGALKAGDRVVGNKTRIRVMKNKLAPPFQVVEVEIIYGHGVCQASELLTRAEKAGVVTRSGAWYSMGDEKIGQGKEAVRDKIRSDDGFAQRILATLQGPVAEAK